MKISGRKRITFWMDQLMGVDYVPDQGWAYQCKMGMTNDSRVFHRCPGTGTGYETKLECEESALAHLVHWHGAAGGERRPQGRRAAYRQRKIDEATARRRAELNRSNDEQPDE